ncbi:hypothetical protein P5808_27925 [Bacillus cereus]|uniref:Stage III sporulation protein AC n=2 Tax=Bacillus cereus group TaxID=86661 RepID=A0AB37E1P8_BACCE|nr:MULTISPECIES: hypothetical protein [Bacillus cereus group]ACI30523.1 hypothetical protein BCH308197_C0012 [Bacillus cereus H3081.97]MDF9505010.1 hypothetical protein [Bacillus cereus]MDF9597771.1 hypothetical protein [Bacillus cereus]MDF9609918.1 hypothetical protein [Bacillus cereus]MDF9660904.1 hypothetical protein [Bacillus cereus]
MNFNLQTITTNIVSQIAFVILLIMAVRAVVSYIRQDWGSFISGVTLGLFCLVITFFGPQLSNFAKAIGQAIFG